MDEVLRFGTEVALLSDMICREKVVGEVMQAPRRSLFLGTYSRFFSWQVWLGSMG